MDIKTVGVVGCGLMGSGIAQVCAEAGYKVIVREVSDELLKKGFVELLEFCGANRIRWGVITNGSALTRAVVERVVAECTSSR